MAALYSSVSLKAKEGWRFLRFCETEECTNAFLRRMSSSFEGLKKKLKSNERLIKWFYLAWSRKVVWFKSCERFSNHFIYLFKLYAHVKPLNKGGLPWAVWHIRFLRQYNMRKQIRQKMPLFKKKPGVLYTFLNL